MDFSPEQNEFALVFSQRVRAILLTEDGKLLLIKRVKPGAPAYWVAPGGGVEHNETLIETLTRELREELGAQIEVMGRAFVLRHQKAGKDLEEHFFICKLVDLDLSLRSGPEFEDPARGEFIPVAIELEPLVLHDLNIKTAELREWLLDHVPNLRQMVG